jgi:DNA-binding MarR family transcriptional regulator
VSQQPERDHGALRPPVPAAPEREVDMEAVARLSLALGRLHRSLRRSNVTKVGPASISALATLVRCGPTRLGDLATREGVTPPTLTRIVTGLEELGYVVRQPDPDDRRATQVQATEAARELVTGIGSARVGELWNRIAALDDDQLETLLKAVPIFEVLAEDN